MKSVTVNVTRTYFKTTTVTLIVEDDFNPEKDELSEENWGKIEEGLGSASFDGGETEVEYEE